MKSLIRSSVLLFIAFTFAFGIVYPAISTVLVQKLFPEKAEGSPIERNKTIVGSRFIGQEFSGSRYFWGRLSATSPYPYNAASSSGSNMGSANPALLDAVKVRIDALKKADPGNTQPIPIDLVTASGSGLDPHISPAAAEYQVSRVARARGLDEERVRSLIEKHTDSRQFWLLGEARVNVLELNLDLDMQRN